MVYKTQVPFDLQASKVGIIIHGPRKIAPLQIHNHKKDQKIDVYCYYFNRIKCS